MKTILSFTFLSVFLVAGVSFAQENSTELELVDEYVRALRSNDESQLRQVWEKISQDPETLAYMSENLPKHLSQFKIQGLYFRAADLNKKGIATASVVDIPNRTVSGSSLGSDDNSDVKERVPNRTNRDITRQYSTVERIRSANTSNSTIARRHSNQKREPNTRRTARR